MSPTWPTKQIRRRSTVKWQSCGSVSLKLLGQKWASGTCSKQPNMRSKRRLPRDLSGLAVDLNIPVFVLYQQTHFSEMTFISPESPGNLTQRVVGAHFARPVRLFKTASSTYIGKEGTPLQVIAQPQLLLDLGEFRWLSGFSTVRGTEVDLRPQRVRNRWAERGRASSNGRMETGAHSVSTPVRCWRAALGSLPARHRHIIRLYGDPSTAGRRTATLPTWCLATLHEHLGYESIWVLAGSQRDEQVNTRPATFVLNAPARSTRSTARTVASCSITWKPRALSSNEVMQIC